MTLKLNLDTSKPATVLTVVSDRRLVTVGAFGETATAAFPVTITDTVRTWKLVSDDGTTAVYSA